MTDEELDALKSALDDELKNVDPKFGVKFGIDAFRGFQRRGWFTMETYTVSGSGAFPIKLPTYAKTRWAICDPMIPDDSTELPSH